MYSQTLSTITFACAFDSKKGGKGWIAADGEEDECNRDGGAVLPVLTWAPRL